MKVIQNAAFLGDDDLLRDENQEKDKLQTFDTIYMLFILGEKRAFETAATFSHRQANETIRYAALLSLENTDMAAASRTVLVNRKPLIIASQMAAMRTPLTPGIKIFDGFVATG